MPGVANGEAVTSAAVLVRDVLRYPVDETLERLRAAEGEAVVEGMVHEFSAALMIERSKFDRINWCLRLAVASCIAWVPLIVVTFTL